MAGLDDETIMRLEKRDDTTRGLFELLKEENIKVNDLIRLKKQYEDQGSWLYRADRVTERLKVVEAQRLAKLSSEALALRDKDERIRRELEPAPPSLQVVAALARFVVRLDQSLRDCAPAQSILLAHL